MHMDPVMPMVVGAILVILLTGFFLKLLNQPHVVAYLIAGTVIGPYGLKIISDVDLITRIGAVGVMLLLFFVGMETDSKKLIANWKLAIFGTLIQILLSVFCAWLIGMWFEWSLAKTLLIGFVISLSSTAVVIKLLQENHLLSSNIGQGILSILLAQDLVIIPMLIILGLLGTGELDVIHLMKQGVGTVLAALLFGYLVKRHQIHLPLQRWLKQDHELQIFAALSICFGFSLLTAWFDLSTALGAFLAGMLIGAARETQWVHHALDPFRVLFIALFFVSIGLMLDVTFLYAHWLQVALLTMSALMTNTFINAVILRLADFSWKDSLYSGAILSQIGEFSFVLAAVGLQASIISTQGYQMALCVISMSLILSPLWISMGKKILKWQPMDRA